MKLNSGLARPEVARELARSAYRFQAEMFPENTSSNGNEIKGEIVESSTDTIEDCCGDFCEGSERNDKSK